ncbi:MAG: ATP-binding protein [Lentimonas sp.]
MDSDHIHQVAINPNSNAIKYMGDGGTVSVRTNSAKDECFLEVKDTGSGIKEANIPNLFDRFYSVNTERSEVRRSTGLGLAISKTIILAHGGDILVRSKLGEGSCFTVRLPA